MNDLVSNGIPKSRSTHLAGIARSMIYYKRKESKQQYDADLEKRLSHIVEERPSYGTRRVTAMIRLSGYRWEGIVYEDICATWTSFPQERTFTGSMCPGQYLLQYRK